MLSLFILLNSILHFSNTSFKRLLLLMTVMFLENPLSDDIVFVYCLNAMSAISISTDSDSGFVSILQIISKVVCSSFITVNTMLLSAPLLRNMLTISILLFCIA
uniref:Fowlpox virus genomic DNA, 11.2 kb-long BamHI-fragment with twenty open reading frames n=1 Tax=Fowlpox virus TaxID=10261 RepID=Q9YPJ7_FOWPV|nr:unnamed protein product [Fowlpox virus]